MPSEEELPSGAWRGLIKAVHELYRAAGKPSLQRIVQQSRASEQGMAAISRDTVSKLLAGRSQPSWVTLQTVLVSLHELAVFSPAEPADTVLKRFHAAWLEASEEPLRQIPAPSSPAPAEALEQPRPSQPTEGNRSLADVLLAGLMNVEPQEQVQALHEWEVAALRADLTEHSARRPVSAIPLAKFLLANNHDPDQPLRHGAPTLAISMAMRIMSRLPPTVTPPTLDGLCMPSVQFAGANLSRALIKEAVLPDADFSRADLSEACLDGSKL